MTYQVMHGVDLTDPSKPIYREAALNAFGQLIVAAAPIPPSPAPATEATLASVLAKLTQTEGNNDTRNSALIAKIQEIINTRKPYQLVQSVDIRSYARARIETRSDGRMYIEIGDVFEDGAQTGVADVNWGLDNTNGAGTSFSYDAAFNGSHTVTVLGVNGKTFTRVFNHQARNGMDTGSKDIYLTQSIYGEVDAQDYLRLTVADAAGMIPVGDFDLQLNAYTPTLPDAGRNKYFLHGPPRGELYIQSRQEELGGGTYTIPQNRVNSFNVWTENTGTNFDVSLDGGTPINYTDSRPFGGFTAKGGYINQRVDITNNGSRIVIATLS